jgi:hypothetical protein
MAIIDPERPIVLRNKVYEDSSGGSLDTQRHHTHLSVEMIVCIVKIHDVGLYALHLLRCPLNSSDVG